MNEDVNNEANEQAPEPTAVEKQAMEQGWVPKDQWTGEGKWRDADDFLDRGELFGKIDHQKRELKALREAQADFKKHLESVKVTEYKRALADLKAQKKEALREGDADAVIELDDQMEEIREAEFTARANASRAPQPNPEERAEFVNWTSRNSWYQTDTKMRDFADTYGIGLHAKGFSQSEVLRGVEAAVKEKFASKFSNPNRERASAVEGAGSGGSAASKDKFVLNDDEKRMMKRIVATGAITEEKYIADLKIAKSRD